jgi:hypothetical protein
MDFLLRRRVMATKRFGTTVQPAGPFDQVLDGAKDTVKTTDRDTGVSAKTNTNDRISVEQARDMNQTIIDRKNKDYV